MTALLVGLALLGAVCTGDRCGDCDGDGLVTIDEILAAVGAALRGDECGVGCYDAALCPETCLEFPQAVVDGVTYECATSLCWTSEAQLARCVGRLVRDGSVFCAPVAP